VVVTAENIHEVKVVLYDKYLTLHKESVSWKASAFKILPPHYLPNTMNRESARTFFNEIKVKNNL